MFFSFYYRLRLWVSFLASFQSWVVFVVDLKKYEFRFCFVLWCQSIQSSNRRCNELMRIRGAIELGLPARFEEMVTKFGTRVPYQCFVVFLFLIVSSWTQIDSNSNNACFWSVLNDTCTYYQKNPTCRRVSQIP